LNVRLLLALDDFLFEDIPRGAGLLSIWASLALSGFCGSPNCTAPRSSEKRRPATLK
jgi:hypothetical protein